MCVLAFVPVYFFLAIHGRRIARSAFEDDGLSVAKWVSDYGSLNKKGTEKIQQFSQGPLSFWLCSVVTVHRIDGVAFLCRTPRALHLTKRLKVLVLAANAFIYHILP